MRNATKSIESNQLHLQFPLFVRKNQKTAKNKNKSGLDFSPSPNLNLTHECPVLLIGHPQQTNQGSIQVHLRPNTNLTRSHLSLDSYLKFYCRTSSNLKTTITPRSFILSKPKNPSRTLKNFSSTPPKKTHFSLAEIDRHGR